ncbi:hypothetical protein ACFQHZ_00360 [Marivibrio halodurans]|nr:hypothetical protein [Marivibrio halodurans]
MTTADPGAPTAHFNADADIVPAALAGADVRIFLQPDETVETRRSTETYIEALDLPHLIIRDGEMWATQRNAVAEPGRPGRVAKNFFSYFTGLDIFANVIYTDDSAIAKTVEAQIMSTGRYKRLRWAARGRFEPVYDSREPEALDRYIAAIEKCSRFKMRIDMEDGTIQIHPVVYPFYFPRLNDIQVDTEIQYFPSFMRDSRAEFLGLLDTNVEMFRDHANPATREKGVQVRAPGFCAFYRMRKGAMGRRIYDIPSRPERRFERIIVFAE